MKKKLIISFSILGGIILLIIILLFTLFGLKNVVLDLRTYNSIYSSQELQKSVIDSGEFAYNMPIFFQNKKLYIEKLEKNNAYLKVINIESKFPNTLSIKCVDREEVFAIKISEERYFILDEDLKVLNILTSFESNQENAILLDGEFSVENKDASVGDFLKLSSGQTLIENFVPAMKLNNRNVSEQRALLKNINIKYRTNPLTAKSEAYLEIYDFLGVKMIIFEAQDSLVMKINRMLAVHSVFDPADANLYELRILKDSNGEIFAHQTQKS